MELPKRAEEHITPALEEAARAVDVRENGRQDQGTGLTPEQLAAKERIRRYNGSGPASRRYLRTVQAVMQTL